MIFRTLEPNSVFANSTEINPDILLRNLCVFRNEIFLIIIEYNIILREKREDNWNGI